MSETPAGSGVDQERSTARTDAPRDATSRGCGHYPAPEYGSPFTRGDGGIGAVLFLLAVVILLSIVL